MAILPTFFSSHIGQEKVFYDILDGKKVFLGYKNKKLKKSKNWYFSKGVNPWFWSKNRHSPKVYFLGNVSQANVFYDIPERRNAFLDYKNKKFNQSKNWHFSKDVNQWFWYENSNFSTFFLGNIGQENVFYHILGRINAFLGYKKNQLKKWKNWHFSKGVNRWFWSKNAHFTKCFF